MLPCSEVTALIGSENLPRAAWQKRVGVWLHLRMCQYCRAYQESIQKLGALARQISAQEPVPGEVVERVRAAVRKEVGE